MAYLTHESVLNFLIRVVLGILFFFQGYDKVFNLKISGVTNYFREESKHKRIPGFILSGSAYLTSIIELVCGALLIVGLFQSVALYLLALDLIIICGAFSLLKPMWDMQLLFPRLILLSALLYLSPECDLLSLDVFRR